MNRISRATDSIFQKSSGYGIDIPSHPDYAEAVKRGWKSVTPTRSPEQALVRHSPQTGTEMLVPHGGRGFGTPEGYTHYAMGDDGLYHHSYQDTPLRSALSQVDNNPMFNGYRKMVHSERPGGDNVEATSDLLGAARDAYLRAEE